MRERSPKIDLRSPASYGGGLRRLPGRKPSLAPPSGTGHGDPEVNFVLVALRETGELVAAALGKDRQRELRIAGAMTMDEAVSYALTNIDPKILTAPVASIDG